MQYSDVFTVLWYRATLLLHFSSLSISMGAAMAIYEPCCSFCVHMSLVVQPAKWLISQISNVAVSSIYPEQSQTQNQPYEFLTALLKVDADENVFPSRYLFSPLILCFILTSNSSALTTKGVSEACHFQQFLVHQFFFIFFTIVLYINTRY